jgi:predicted metal-dependent phosphoesterase TrpH
VIDLHLHTSASDGRDTPRELVERCVRENLAVIAVTDHDTVAAVGEAGRLAADAGLRLVPGIEITTWWRGQEVHLLGYFLDPGSARLAGFLEAQRADRVRRIRDIAARLARLGAPIDVERLLEHQARDPQQSVGRPQVARALVEAGHVPSAIEAFDLYLAEGRPACVPRGDPPSTPEAMAVVAESGGVTSIAHPGLLRDDDAVVRRLARSGLDAIEAYHCDHSPAAGARYAALAARCGLLVSGGSDYHGEGSHGAPAPGAVRLPPDDFHRLAERAEARRRERQEPGTANRAGATPVLAPDSGSENEGDTSGSTR